MLLSFLSFFAGVLTVLAPCVLPILPVIMGSGLDTKRWYNPLIIIGSAGFFIILFTLLLKGTTAFISISDSFWWTISGAIIIFYGITLLYPNLWENISNYVGLKKFNRIASMAKNKGNIVGDIILGASLGPIFASCSPTYAVLLGIVLPQNFYLGLFNIFLYVLGFVIILTLVTYGGRAVIKNLRRASSSEGKFKKGLAVFLIFIGILIATGYLKDIEFWLIQQGIWDSTRLEYQLLDQIGIQ